ncbi:MAG: ATP-binding cassette domain-containing protein [Mycoplasmatales bacterium]
MITKNIQLSYKYSIKHVASCFLLPFLTLLLKCFKLSFIFLLIELFVLDTTLNNKAYILIIIIIGYSIIDYLVYIWNLYIQNTRFKIIKSFKEEIINKALAISYEDLQKKEIKGLYYKALESINQGYLGIGGTIFVTKDLLVEVYLIITVICFSLVYSIYLFAFFSVSLIIMLFIYREVGSIEKLKEEKVFQAKTNQQVSERYLTEIAFAKELRIFNFRELFMRKYNQDSIAIIIAQKKFNRKKIKFDLVVNLIKACLYFGCFYIFISTNSLSLLIIFLALNEFIYASERMVLPIRRLKVIEEQSKSVYQFLELSEVEKRKLEYELPADWTIKIENLNYWIEQKKVLDNLQFCIRRNEKICILGRNGAGKSTLLHFLSGLIEAPEAQIKINDQQLDLRSKEFFEHVTSTIFQETVTYSETILENSDLNVSESVLAELLKTTDIRGLQQKKTNTMMTKYFDDNGIELSGGEYQKFEFLKLQFQNKKIILLDEPSSAMDKYSEITFFENLFETYHDNTVLVVVHNYQIISEFEKCLVLDEGKIIFAGEVSGYIKTNHYLKMINNLEEKNEGVR